MQESGNQILHNKQTDKVTSTSRVGSTDKNDTSIQALLGKPSEYLEEPYCLNAERSIQDLTAEGAKLEIVAQNWKKLPKS